MDNSLGHALKELRKSKNMTLTELSDCSDLSVSYLSMLERGLNSPTIANLQKICNVFDIMLPELLSRLDGSSPLVKKKNREIVFEDEKGVRYESITEGTHTLTGIVMIVTDNRMHMSDVHATDELGYIISGTINMTVDGTTYPLEAGDAFYIPAYTHHSFEKTSYEECHSIWIYPASSFREYPKNKKIKKR